MLGFAWIACVAAYLLCGWFTAQWLLRDYRRSHPIATALVMAAWWMVLLAQGVLFVHGWAASAQLGRRPP